MKYLFCSLISLFSSTFFAQDFIDDYIGEWSGYMMIANSNVPVDTVITKMTIAEEVKDSVWTWRTSYEGKFNVVKDYKLVKTANANEYLLDEGDGITLKLYRTDNQLTSIFYYTETLMFTMYSLIGDKLLFDIYISNSSLERKVNEEIGDYPLLATQKTVLTRVK